jgi:ribosomal-protein-alanine N-acetyltransferase
MTAPTALGPRPLRWWDVERLLPLERELFGTEAWSAETWWAELAQPAQRAYVIADAAVDPAGDPDGEVLGYAGVSVAAGVGDVMTVAVSPAAQGQGLGRRLVAELLTLAEARGATRVMLEVRADNVAAQRVYAACGFERIAVRRGYYRTPAGPADAWVMQRRLASGGGSDG